jgi:hypothetical protein
MYSQSFLMTSVRGRGVVPTMAANSVLGFKDFMKADSFFGAVLAVL